MSHHFSYHLCLATALLALAGCADMPPDRQPTYSYVAVPDPTPRRPDRVRYVLAPDACSTPDPTAATPTGPLLAPGCANDFNLLRMTERQEDLVQGRKLGRAAAAPTVRAAQRYINGAEGPLGASVGKPGGTTAPATTEDETAQKSKPAAAPSQR